MTRSRGVDLKAGCTINNKGTILKQFNVLL